LVRAAAVGGDRSHDGIMLSRRKLKKLKEEPTPEAFCSPQIPSD
jgi:hypothetical protein